MSNAAQEWAVAGAGIFLDASVDVDLALDLPGRPQQHCWQPTGRGYTAPLSPTAKVAAARRAVLFTASLHTAYRSVIGVVRVIVVLGSHPDIAKTVTSYAVDDSAHNAG